MAKLIGDQLFPASIDDSLVGGAGNDYLFGGELNDTLSGGDGVDSIDGGTGSNDWITFSDVSGGVDISLLAVAVPVTTIQMVSIDEATAGVIGFDTTSTIVNDPTGEPNKVVRVEKGTGALGAAGTTVYINGANDSIGVIPFTADSTTVTMNVFMPIAEAGVRVRMKLENANNVQQTVEADALTTDVEGWQTLTFDFAQAATNGGNPTARLDLDFTFNKVSVFFNFGLSTANGGGGVFYFDDLNFVRSPDPAGVIADDGFGNTESIANVEHVLGSSFGDRITGGTGANTLQGVGGNDTIDGGAGNDLLEGGLGNDSVQGGLGNDNINAGDGNDTISGGAGVDSMDGGTSTDTVSFANAEGGVEVVVRSGSTASTVVNFEESTPPTLASFGPDDAVPGNVDIVQESIVTDPAGGSNKVAKFVKNAGAEVWAGLVVSTGPNSSVDPLPLTATDNTMTLRVWTEKPGVQVLLKLENATAGAINTGAFATTTVESGWETLTFTFGPALSGPNTGAFNPASIYNKVVLFFDFGLNGTAGAGTFYFDDLKIISTPVGEIIDDGFGNTETLVNVESAIGSAFADRLTGEGANNSLSGGGGNDTLDGGAGNDALNGGAGDDAMTGGAGNDSYTVDSTADVITESGGQGTDRVSSSISHALAANVENLALSGTGNINGTGNTAGNSITGNAGNNVLAGGTSTGTGNDTLSGGDGNDSLSGLDGNDSLVGGNGNDTLNGSTGNDAMIGGAGNDLYYVNSTADVVTESSGQGTDRVSSSISHTLAANVENLSLSGTGNTNGTGNTGSNSITGNAGNNLLVGGTGTGTGNDTLSGGDGNDSLSGLDGNDSLVGGNGDDVLNGGTGNDTMTGGAGNDLYYVDSATDVITESSGQGTDRVSSSISYSLKANVENLVLSGSGNRSAIGNAGNNVITGNAGNNFLVGGTGTGTGNDTISGGDGNDYLQGLDGNDSLIGGNARDTLDGGAGLDIFRFSSAVNGNDNDTVFDFSSSDDILQLENAIFSKLASTGVLSAAFFRASTTGLAVDSNDYVLYDTDNGTGLLFYDADGSGPGARVLIAALTGAPTLTSADIFVT